MFQTSVEIFCVYPRLHSISVVWNRRLTWKLLSPVRSSHFWLMHIDKMYHLLAVLIFTLMSGLHSEVICYIGGWVNIQWRIVKIEARRWVGQGGGGGNLWMIDGGHSWRHGSSSRPSYCEKVQNCPCIRATNAQHHSPGAAYSFILTFIPSTRVCFSARTPQLPVSNIFEEATF